MVKTVSGDSKDLFQCEECGLFYENREIAGRCKAWCREHKSCNLEIIRHAYTPKERL